MKAWVTMALFFAGVALASERENFAWHWPLPLVGDEGLVALHLDASMYRYIQRADLRDLVAFNGAGEMIPLAPVTPPERLLQPAQIDPVPVPWFRVPGAHASGDERIALLIARGEDGRLSRLEAEVAAQGETVTGEAILIDLSAYRAPVSLIAFEFDLDPGASLNARVSVEGSEDLSRWQGLAQELALVDLSAGGARLQRHRLVLPATSLTYLRISRTDSLQPLPIVGIGVLPVVKPVGVRMPATRRIAVRGEVDLGNAGAFVFRSDGPYPISQINLRLADRNSIAEIVLSSRSNNAQPWRRRARFTAFQIEGGGDTTHNVPVEVGVVRDREWRVQTEPPQARAPLLELEYVPDRFLLMTQGEGPFLVAAGSVRGERPDYPLRALLADLQAVRGSDWQPPQIEPGLGAPLAGDAALQPLPEPLPLRRWLLWGVLVIGVGLLMLMVVSLLKQERR